MSYLCCQRMSDPLRICDLQNVQKRVKPPDFLFWSIHLKSNQLRLHLTSPREYSTSKQILFCRICQ